MPQMPDTYVPSKVHRAETPHPYGTDAELRILKLARSFIAKGWYQATMMYGVKAVGPARERDYIVYGTSPVYYSQTSGYGSICHPAAEDAERWTIEGAIERALYELNIPKFGPTGLSIPHFNIHMAISATSPDTWPYGFEDWNNHKAKSQDQVLELFDRAIYHFEQVM